jgi:outer membrane protein
MKKTALVCAATIVSLFCGQAMAQESPWLVRLRAVDLMPANQSDQVGGVGASDRLSVEKKVIPEFDISYFFTDHIAAELVLTYPQKHEVYLDGAGIGTFKHLPPTLMAQYHFLPGAQFDPYVGLGVNYTHISSVHLLNGAGDLDSNSTGLAAQVGVDYKIDRHWSFNIDVKKVQIGSDVMISGAKVSHVNVDPLMIGVGVGYRF